VFLRHYAPLTRGLLAAGLLAALAACAPEPPETVLPTLPAVLDITPAPTLDIDATATAFANLALPTPTAAALYTIQAGDTLSELADRFDTTVDELVAANGLTDPNNLQPGQTLLIPSLLRTPVAGPQAPMVTPSPTLSTP
jgi:LysM repeat protein